MDSRIAARGSDFLRRLLPPSSHATEPMLRATKSTARSMTPLSTTLFFADNIETRGPRISSSSTVLYSFSSSGNATAVMPDCGSRRFGFLPKRSKPATVPTVVPAASARRSMLTRTRRHSSVFCAVGTSRFWMTRK